jgi:adenosylhomocysteine nucleosidase
LGHVGRGCAREPRLLVVSGLAAEAKIAATGRHATLCGGGNIARLEAEIIAAFRDGVVGIVSFGIAGGLVPNLPAGAVVLAKSVMSKGDRHHCDPVWLRRLGQRLPAASNAVIFGADAPLGDRRRKATLGTETGAVAVDMESHIVARLAARHGVPFAAVRIISDPVERSLPPAAMAGMRSDGKADIPAVLRSLWRKPRQLPPLLRTALDARLAFASLRQCRPSLGDDFCFYA